MNIVSYVKSLLPSFGRNHVIDDIARMRSELENSLLPSLEQAARAFKHQPLKSEMAVGIEVTLRSRFPSFRNKNLFDILLAIFKDAPAKLDALEKVVESYFAKDVEAEAITYRHATMIQSVELFSFAIHYTMRTVIRVVAAESFVLVGMPNSVDSQLLPAESKYFEDKYVSWLDSLRILNKPTHQLEEAIVETPDIAVDEHNGSAVLSTFGAKKLDPMGLNFIAPSWNPIYHFRMHRAEMDVAALNNAKEERRLVELRLRDLKNKQQGHEDAHLERRIEVTENRLQKLDFKINKLSGNH